MMKIRHKSIIIDNCGVLFARTFSYPSVSAVAVGDMRRR